MILALDDLFNSVLQTHCVTKSFSGMHLRRTQCIQLLFTMWNVDCVPVLGNSDSRFRCGERAFDGILSILIGPYFIPI